MTKKKPLGGKYRFRRFILFALMFALFGAGGWFAYEKFDVAGIIPAMLTVEESESEPEQGSEPDSESEPEPESESEPDSEPESEPDAPPAVSAQDWELILVNGDNPIPENYAPELETITDMYRVDKRIADNVKLMFADAKASGINLIICSAYRSAEKQGENFDNKKQEHIAKGKTEDEAIAVTSAAIAKPGTSEHQTGLALDIVTSSYQSLNAGFENTPAFKWLSENAHKHGFILRYPKDKQDITDIVYEPWHYRYVGEKNAAVIKESGLCLEEYIEALNGFPLLAEPSQTETEDNSDAEPKPEPKSAG